MPTIPTKLRVQATQKTKNNSILYRYQINIKCNKWRLSERSILQISGADAKRWFTEVFTRHLFCNSENIDRFSSYALGTSLKISQGKVRENEKKKTLAPFSKPDLALTHPLTYAIRTSTHDTDSDTTTHTHTRPPRLRRPPPVASRARPASRTHGQIAS